MLQTVEYCSRYCRRNHQRWASGVLCCVLVCVAVATADAQNGQSASFEVASVRLTAPGVAFSQRITNTRLDLVKFPLRQVLWLAFRIEPSQSGRLSVPDWTRDLRVDIHAIFPEGSRDLVPEMLQTLLTERFGLRTSVTARMIDGYELVVGSGGIRMLEVGAVNELDKKFETNPSLGDALVDRTLNEIGGPVRLTHTPRGLRTTTERSTYERVYNRTGRRTWQLDATRITMAEFASLLTANLGRPVLDRTKLTGLYQFQVELPFDASVAPLLASLGLTKTVDGQPLNDPTGVSALKAVEQLGLKLEPRRLALDTIVVENINKVPTEN